MGDTEHVHEILWGDHWKFGVKLQEAMFPWMVLKGNQLNLNQNKRELLLGNNKLEFRTVIQPVLNSVLSQIVPYISTVSGFADIIVWRNIFSQLCLVRLLQLFLSQSDLALVIYTLDYIILLSIQCAFCEAKCLKVTCGTYGRKVVTLKIISSLYWKTYISCESLASYRY